MAKVHYDILPTKFIFDIVFFLSGDRRSIVEKIVIQNPLADNLGQENHQIVALPKIKKILLKSMQMVSGVFSLNWLMNSFKSRGLFWPRS
jgi:hypothetical protein